MKIKFVVFRILRLGVILLVLVYEKTISFDGSSSKKGQLSKMTVVFTLYSPPYDLF